MKSNALKSSRQAGFNLVELMIVIAIMATLAAIAIPSYSHYINRSRAVSAIVLTEPVRAEVTEYGIMHNGNFNDVNNNTLHLSNADLLNGSRDVNDITIASQGSNQVSIIATLADDLGVLTWKGVYQNGNMQWACTYPANEPIAHYAPKGCSAA